MMTNEDQVAALAKVVLAAALDRNARFVITMSSDHMNTTVLSIDAAPIARAILAAGYALRADVLEEAAAVCDKRAVTLNDMSNAQGDHPNRFKINTAWHETVDLAATIRAMKAAK